LELERIKRDQNVLETIANIPFFSVPPKTEPQKTETTSPQRNFFTSPLPKLEEPTKKEEQCSKCGSPFSMFKRKQICKVCRKLYCNKCTGVGFFQNDITCQSCQDQGN